jgi:hypothetical protein
MRKEWQTAQYAVPDAPAGRNQSKETGRRVSGVALSADEESLDVKQSC